MEKFSGFLVKIKSETNNTTHPTKENKGKSLKRVRIKYLCHDSNKPMDANLIKYVYTEFTHVKSSKQRPTSQH